MARTGVARLQQELATLRHQMSGVKTTPSPNPGTYVALPWNAFTYEREVVTTTASQTFDTSVTEVLTQLLLRIGLSSATHISIKIRSAQVWGTSAGPDFPLPDILVGFHELANPQTANTVRSTQRDKGTLNMPAKTGYLWPSSDSREVLDSSTPGLKLISAAATDIGTYVTVRIQFLWKANVP